MDVQDIVRLFFNKVVDYFHMVGTLLSYGQTLIFVRSKLKWQTVDKILSHGRN